MRLVIVAVFDRASQTFANPWYVTHIGAATRSFIDEVNRHDITNTVYQHPTDFELFELGAFENGDASFQLLEAPRLITRGDDVAKPRT